MEQAYKIMEYKGGGKKKDEKSLAKKVGGGGGEGGEGDKKKTVHEDMDAAFEAALTKLEAE